MYGSSRLGTLDTALLVYPRSSYALSPPIVIFNIFDTSRTIYTEGQKQYELTNHLGNVFVTLSDKKIPVDSLGTPPAIANYYLPLVITSQDYYPFGMLMPGRNFNTTGFRFGFNGKEKTDELYGVGNAYDYGMRMYSARLGKFMSIDPLAKKYPNYSPFMYAGDKPIRAIDMDGLEDEIIWSSVYGAGTNNIYISTFSSIKGDVDYENSKSSLSPFIDFTKTPADGTLLVQTVQGDKGDYSSIHFAWTPSATVVASPTLGQQIEKYGEFLEYLQQDRYYGQNGLKNLSNDLGKGSNDVKLLGMATTLFAPETGAGPFIYELGSGGSTVSNAGAAISDLAEGKKGEAAIRALNEGISRGVGYGTNKIPNKFIGEATNYAADESTKNGEDIILGKHTSSTIAQKVLGNMPTTIGNGSGGENYPAYDEKGNSSFTITPNNK